MTFRASSGWPFAGRRLDKESAVTPDATAVTPDAPAALLPPAPLRRNRPFQWLLGGSFVSMLGSRLTTIAYPLLVLAWGGSPAIAGLAVCAANAPSVLVYIPAGVLVDRWPDPRRILVIAEAIRGCAIACVAIVVLVEWKHILVIVLVAIIEESAEVFAMLAERRCVRNLVQPVQAPAAQVGMEAREHVVVLAGRALGGLLFGLAQSLPFLADFCSFVISLAALDRIRRVQGGAGAAMHSTRPSLGPLWDEVRAGWRELWADAFVRYASLLSAGMTLVSQALIIVFLAAAHSGHVSSVVVGSVLAASGIGGLLGAMISRRGRWPWNLSPLKFQPLVWTIMLLALAMSGWLQVPAMALAMTVLGFFGAMGNVEIDTYLIVKVPDRKLARVSSIEMLLDFLASVLGPALGGCLTECWGTEAAIWILLVVSGFIALASFVLRNLVIEFIAVSSFVLRNLVIEFIAVARSAPRNLVTEFIDVASLALQNLVIGFIDVARSAPRNPVTARQSAIPELPVASERKREPVEAAPAPRPHSRDGRIAERQPATAGSPSAKRHRAGVS
ncbi:MAG: MFS transporter [Trebonia sp.]